ncbi:MAG TPA: Rrf2 family transcriptional regulator, partial [Chitinophagaceae bacterium]
RQLRMAGFINSTPGYKGGYILALPADKIVINAVLKSLGGALYDQQFCGSHSGVLNLCVNSVDCSSRSLWKMIQFTVDQLLDKITVADLIKSDTPSSQRLKDLLIENTPGIL